MEKFSSNYTDSILLAIGSVAVLLSTATQFRIGRVGIGEVLGLCFLIISIFKYKIPNTNGSRWFYFGFLLWLSALCGGWFYSILFGLNDFDVFTEFLGVLYAPLLVFGLYILTLRNQNSLQTMIYILALVPILLLIILKLSDFHSIGIWFGAENDDLPSTRYVGWSTNPNQIGIMLVSMPFLCIYGLLNSNRGLFKLYLLFAAIATLYLSKVVQSDTVFISYILCGFFVIYKLFGFARFIISLLLISIFAGLFFNFDFSIADIYNKGGSADANGRFPIWSSFPALFIKSPVFGFGPGSFAGIDIPFQGWEFHCLPMDVASQSGIVGTVVLASFIYTSIKVSLKHGLFVSLVVLATLVEMLTHNTQRHPFFWLYLSFPFFCAAQNRTHSFLVK